jgi:hypothetical protein
MTLFGEVYIAPKNEMHIASGSLYFESGKIITERGSDAGTLSFAKGTHWEKADHDTHVDGFIRFYDASEFSFPLRHNNVLQPIHVSDFSGSNHFDVAYHHQGYGINQSEDTIVTVSDNYFWELRNPKGKGFVMLSWNTFSNIHKLLERSPSPENALDLITIGGFDGEQWIPIESKLSENPLDGGSSSSLLSGLIKSKKTVDFSEFKAFSLMMRNIPAIVSKNVSQAITPNGDGKNDTWVIERIEQYPHAKVAAEKPSSSHILIK